MTGRTTADNDEMNNDTGHERVAADRLARRVLEGMDRAQSWREAGYQTAEDAARALVGAGGEDDAVVDLAVGIVVAALDATETRAIEALRREATAASDPHLLAICDRALNADFSPATINLSVDAARAECARVIAEAREVQP